MPQKPDVSSLARPSKKKRGLLPRELLLQMLRALKATRELEDRIDQKLYRQGKIVGGVFVSRGQEAISVGAALAFEDDDLICPSHRDMGVYLLRGMTMERILGNYLGRVIGPSHGKDGNIHTGDLDLNLVSFISHLADTVPVATGIGLAYKIRKSESATAVFFGDGGSSRGDVHEGLNLAAVMNLPVVFICNNNQYAYSTPINKTMAAPSVAERASGYGFPALSVDGNDVLEVYRVVKEAVDRARAGRGATLIEAHTFRMAGHAAHDDAWYVPKHLFKQWEKKDPIRRLERYLLDNELITKREIDRIDSDTQEQIDTALKVAEESVFPDPEDALTDVFASPPRNAPIPPWRDDAPSVRIETLERAEEIPIPAPGDAKDSADQKEVTYVEAIAQGLSEEMARDPNVFVLGEDVADYGGAFKVTEGLLDRFGESRVIDTPIAESGIVGAAAGASMLGLRPVVEMQFIDFISCAFDQITNFAAKCRYRWGAAIPIVIRGPCGGGVSGGPFHSQNVESFFLNTPGLKIVAPATAYDARGLLKSAIRDDDPVLYFEHKFLYRRVKEVLPPGDGAVQIGRAAIRRRGQDLTIVTFGAMVYRALEAATALAADGIEVEVVDLRSLLPLDIDAILESVSKTNRALVLHEATLTGGIGGELSALIGEHAFEYLDAPIRRVAAIDTPVPFSGPLEKYFLPQVDDIIRVAREQTRY